MSAHPPLSEVEKTRPDYQSDAKIQYTKRADPDWKFGEGAHDGGASLQKKHREIDPYAEGRPPATNYKLLTSAIVPRPIGFVSTVSKDGECRRLQALRDIGCQVEDGD
jgi:hypothetical protein